MAFRMSENSLFAVLLRSSWWYSVLIGLFLIAVSLLIAGGKYVFFGIFTALPFFGIAGYTAYRQLQQPGKKRVIEVATQARKMSSKEIAAKISENYEQHRFDAEPFKGTAADVELTRGARKLLLCSKRFKAATTGIEPLKQLVAAGEKAEATGYLYVTLGDISANAQDYARKNDIEVIRADKLAVFFDGKAKIE